jgi:hypothetical protein
MRSSPNCQLYPDISLNTAIQQPKENGEQNERALLISKKASYANSINGLNPFFISKEYLGVILLPAL